MLPCCCPYRPAWHSHWKKCNGSTNRNNGKSKTRHFPCSSLRTVDDAPFYYATYGGEFEAKVKITGDYQARFDQAGIMIRIDHKNYIKAGIEFVDGKYNLSTVVTHNTSDWSVTTLEKAVPYIWIKAVRRLNAVEIFYSFDDKNYTLMRNAWLQDNTPVQVGLMAACPDGKGFKATFEHFKVKHLPDQRRLEWLRKNAE